jgi:hypothetical protein
MTDIFDAIRIFLLIVFAIVGNILWYSIKSILSDKGYETYWYRGHFSNLFDFSDLISKTTDPTDKKTYKNLFRGLLITLVFFIGTIAWFILDVR